MHWAVSLEREDCLIDCQSSFELFLEKRDGYKKFGNVDVPTNIDDGLQDKHVS